MSTLLSEAATVELMGRSPWPDDVRLFQQYEVGQILMPDFAHCLSVKAFLNMLSLKFQTELRLNAEFMSPSGEIPFIQIGPLIVSEFDSIVAVAAAKGHSLSADLSDDQRTEMKAYISLVRSSIGNALLYILWCDKKNLNLITKPRYGSAYKWPLNRILPISKHWQVTRRLKSLGWLSKTEDEVFQEVDACCQALSCKLGSQPFFFDKHPTELDAVVFGYLYTILTTELTTTRLVDILHPKYKNLNELCQRLHDLYFNDEKD